MIKWFWFTHYVKSAKSHENWFEIKIKIACYRMISNQNHKSKKWFQIMISNHLISNLTQHWLIYIQLYSPKTVAIIQLQQNKAGLKLNKLNYTIIYIHCSLRQCCFVHINKNTATAKRSWRASCSTSLYHNWCHRNGPWLLLTDSDGRTLLITAAVWTWGTGDGINIYYLWRSSEGVLFLAECLRLSA